ncbi:MAG TPA: carboxypeptidase regulatory-like domain-containing protein [Polyangia bacterium]|nr:carboxypeptidase regulatory-like domain-containing protein [Polyangia bacterium]
MIGRLWLLATVLVPAAALAQGSVAGVVKLSGPVPRRPAYKVTKDAAVCGAAQPDETLVVSPGGALANVVVSLRVPRPAAPPPPTPNAAVDQRGCRYEPHVQAVTAGTPVALVNSDAVLHNVHGSAGPIQVFNVAMPIRNQRLPTKLTRPGLVRLQCDAGHTWMGAWIDVFDHPYFAVTGADGKFVIKDVPPGHYTVDFWHEPADGKGPGVTTTAAVEVTDGATATADATLKL